MTLWVMMAAIWNLMALAAGVMILAIRSTDRMREKGDSP